VQDQIVPAPSSPSPARRSLLHRCLGWGAATLGGLLLLVILTILSLPVTLPWLATHRVPDWLRAEGLPPMTLEIEEAGWSKMTIRALHLGSALRIDRLSLSMNPLARSFGRLQISGLSLAIQQDGQGNWRIPDLYPLPSLLAVPAEAVPTWQELALALGPSLALVFEIDSSTITVTTPQATITLSLDNATLSGPLLGDLSGHISLRGQTTLRGQEHAPLTARIDSDWQAGRSTLTLENPVASLSVDGPLHWQDIDIPAGSEWVVTANDASATALTIAFPPSLIPPFSPPTDDEVFRIIPSLILVSPSVDIRLPSGNHLKSSYDGITIGGSLSLGADASLSEVALTGSLRDGTLSVGGLVVDQLQSDLTRQNGHLELALGASILTLPGEPPLSAGSAAQGVPQKPLRLKLTAHQQDDDPAAADSPLPPMAFTMQITTAQGQELLHAEGSHDVLLGKGQASVQLPPLTFAQDGLQPGHLHRALLGTLTSVSGQISGRGNVRWAAGHLTPAITITLKDVGVSRGFLNMRGINGSLRLNAFWPPLTPDGQRITVAAIDAGLPLTDGVIDFHLDGRGNIVTEKASLTLARGALETSNITLPLERAEGLIPLRVRNMSLRTLSRYSQLDGLELSGSVSGTLPLMLNDADILITDGLLEADRPGTLRYRPPDGIAGLGTDNMGMELLLTALNDFRYKALRLSVNGSAAGELALGLHIAGANPTLYDGYPLEFNLSISGGLSNLIASTVENSTVPERLRKRLEQQMAPATAPKKPAAKGPR